MDINKYCKRGIKDDGSLERNDWFYNNKKFVWEECRRVVFYEDK